MQRNSRMFTTEMPFQVRCWALSVRHYLLAVTTFTSTFRFHVMQPYIAGWECHSAKLENTQFKCISSLLILLKQRSIFPYLLLYTLEMVRTSPQKFSNHRCAKGSFLQTSQHLYLYSWNAITFSNSNGENVTAKVLTHALGFCTCSFTLVVYWSTVHQKMFLTQLTTLTCNYLWEKKLTGTG